MNLNITQPYNTNFHAGVALGRHALEESLQKGMSVNEIAQLFKVSSDRIYDLIRVYGLKTPRDIKTSNDNPFYNKLNTELPKLIEKGYTVKEMMGILSVKKYVIDRWLKINLPEGLNKLKRLRNE